MKKLVSLLLAVVMTLGLVPFGAMTDGLDTRSVPAAVEEVSSAACGMADFALAQEGKTANEIIQQIKDTYTAAKQLNGGNSFNGWCGNYVGYQLQVLGINTSCVGGNGNNQFDYYCNKTQTTGGYGIVAYPSSSYSITSALNEMCSSGNVYNILVGFTTGWGSDGQLYGHVMFIHAIIDGTVYYSESFSGTYGNEGAPISCTISQFASRYGQRVSDGYNILILDGLIHFISESANYTPIGTADDISGGTNCIHIRGWAFDSDCPSMSIKLHVYIGGEYVQSIMANTYRPDVNSAYGVGDYHGYDAYVETGKIGSQYVEIYALNADSSGNYTGNQNTRIGEGNVIIEYGVNIHVSSANLTAAVPVLEGGTGIVDDNYMYIGITAYSKMYALHYLIDYPEEYVSIIDETSDWPGSISEFTSVAMVDYEGYTGGVPVGESGNIYINGGAYGGPATSGGDFHRFTLRLDKAPLYDDCLQDSIGYYLPIGIQLLEFEYWEDNGYASENYAQPEYADWLSATGGKIYVMPVDHYHSLQYISATIPTCTEDGHISYYFCEGCSKCFADADGENEITLASTVIPALGHEYHEEDDVYYPATCVCYEHIQHTCWRCSIEHNEYLGEKTDWSTDYPEGIDEVLVEIGTEYRYRDHEETNSSESNLEGWHLYATVTEYGEYGAWSEWQFEVVSDTDLCMVQTRTVYPYYYFYCHSCGTGARYPYWNISCEICGMTIPSNTGTVEWYPNPWSDSTPWGSNTGKYYQYINNCIVWNWSDGAPTTQYRYCVREEINTYFYDRWTDWSDWSAEPIEASDTREVEMRTVYRYVIGEYGPHQWDEGVVTNEPSRTEPGVVLHNCQLCSETHTETFTAEPVDIFVTDADFSGVTAVANGGTGIPGTSSKKFFYVGISSSSSMYSMHYLIDYPEELISITSASCSWSGSIISSIIETIEDGEQTSDEVRAVCTTNYVGQTGNEPVGEAGNVYINGKCYLAYGYSSLCGLQEGGSFYRFAVRLDDLPTSYYYISNELMQDEYHRYYFPLTIEVLDYQFCFKDSFGNIHVSGYSDVDTTDGKIYVDPWSNTEYYVVYTVNGEDYERQSYKYGATIIPPEFEVPEGYTFSGWDVPETMPNYGITVDATLIPNTYTINCYLGGELYQAIDVVFGTDIILPSIEEEGYDFSGWHLEDGSDVPAAMPANNLNVYGTLTRNYITVTYVGAYVGTEEVAYGGNAVLPVLDVEGAHYTFTVNGEPWDGTNVTEDVTVEVGMDIDVYTVDFIDPVTGETLSTQQVEYGDPAAAPEAPAHYGYTFDGWDAEFGCVTGDMTVNAIYTPVLFNVYFMDGWSDEVVSEQQVPYLSSAENPAEPVREGWIFAGWDTDYSCVEYDLVINALWERQYLTVTFTGTYTGTEVVEYGSDCLLPVYNSNSLCYTFKVNGEEWCPENVTEDVTVTVGAALIKNTYHTVTFVGMDGEVIATVQVKHGEAATAPDAPAVPGYTFIGWDRDNFDCVKYTMTRTAVYEESQIVYHTVTFVDWDGTVLSVQQVEDGADAVAPERPSRADYSFIGWDVDYTNVTEDLVVTALYEPNQHYDTVGDADGNGVLSFSDVAALYNMILSGGGLTAEQEYVCDVNGDGAVSFADVAALYNVVLGAGA